MKKRIQETQKKVFSHTILSHEKHFNKSLERVPRVALEGDPVVIVLKGYNTIYEGIITTGVDDVKEMSSKRGLIFVEPDGWAMNPRDLTYVKDKDIINEFTINNNEVWQRYVDLGFMWVMYTKIVKA